MFQQILAIIRNTFFESVRQPVMLVVLIVAALLIVLSNPLAAFTMDDDQRMLIDIGLATVFTGGTLLAAFIATSVLTREIDNKTALTVISKPVGRPLFVIGKFVGVALAMTVGTLFMSFTFLLVEHHTVLQTVRDPVHLPVITFGVLAAVLGLGVGVWCNYFYGLAFASTTICATTPLVALAYVLSLLFNPDFSMLGGDEFATKIVQSIKPGLWLALVCLLVAILLLTSVAVAASTRLGQVMTLTVTFGVFLLGMLSDWLFGRPIANLQAQWLARANAAGQTRTEEVVQTIRLYNTDENNVVRETVEVATVPLTSLAEGSELLGYAAAWVGHAIVPNLQRLWLADALTQNHVIPVGYAVSVTLYGLLYMVVALSLAVILFQRREVG